MIRGPMFWNGHTLTMSYILDLHGENWIMLIGVGYTYNQ